MTPLKTTGAAFLAIALLTLSFRAQAQAPACEGTPSNARLLIDIDGMTSAKGLMSASLYPDDKSQFMIKDGALKVWYAPVDRPVTHMCIWLKSPGKYAMAVYHDANSNHKFDKSLFGYSERVGFSNNPRLFLALPSFESVLFNARPGDTTLHIHLVSGK